MSMAHSNVRPNCFSFSILTTLLALAAVRAHLLVAASGAIVNFDVQTGGGSINIASDESWNKYCSKGALYQRLFAADDEGAGKLVEDSRTPPSAQSLWRGNMYADRHTWNWHENYFDADNCNFEYLHLKDAFEALKLNTYCRDDEEHEGHNVGWSLGHYDESRVDDSDPSGWHHNMLPPIEQTYVAEGKTYKSTGAYYTFVVNQVSGLIFALDILSPTHAIGMHWKSLGDTAAPEDLPKLQHGSDLIWGKWMDGNPDVKNLQVYAVYSVLNDETTALVSRALRSKGVDGLTTWPGAIFDKEQDEVEFPALIGSPIGGTISMLLVQHKTELGDKEIHRVHVVSDQNSLQKHQATELHMFFLIRDVPPSKAGELD